MAEPQAHREVARRRAAVVAVGGLIVLVAGMVAVRNGSVSSVEQSIFRAVNDLPEAFYPVMWPLQQLGSLAAGPVVAAAALLLRRVRLAIAALIATVAKLALERAVKAMVSRARPATSIGPDINTRGDVSLSGESFVSGHAILVTALAAIIQPYLRGRWKAVPWVVVALVLIARVYVGAHSPLDVICGAGLGFAIAGVITLIVPPHPPNEVTSGFDAEGGPHATDH